MARPPPPLALINLLTPRSVPSNLQFQVDDIEDEWTFSYKFDFVYARMLTGSIGDWPKFMKQSFDSLNPGGWVECHDIAFPVQCDDGTLAEDSHLKQWSDLMIKATEVFGRTAESAHHYKQQMIDAGFVNVTEVVYKWPTNRWPADPYYKELGINPRCPISTEQSLTSNRLLVLSQHRRRTLRPFPGTLHAWPRMESRTNRGLPSQSEG